MNWKVYRNLAILSGTITIGSLFTHKINYHNESLYNLAHCAQTADRDNAPEFLSNALKTVGEIDDILIKESDLNSLKSNIGWYLETLSTDSTNSEQYINSINYGLANRFKNLAEHSISQKLIKKVGMISFIVTILAGFYSEIKHIEEQYTLSDNHSMHNYNR